MQKLGEAISIKKPGYNYVTNQPFVAVSIVFGQHNGLFYTRIAQHGPFNLARFDTVSPNFNLLVDAAQIGQITVGQLPGQITASVQPGIRVSAERVRYEALSGQFGLIQIPPRQARATNV